MSDSIITFTGTPKSGMSILIQCLRILGLQALDHHHDMDVSSINRLLFQGLDHLPTMAGPLNHDWMRSRSAKHARQRILDLLSDHQQATVPLFVADPFLCRFLPLWIECFDEAELISKFVFVVRHPWEVAQSVAEDANIGIGEAHLLWLAHVRDSLRYCQNSVLISFDQLLADPLAIMLRVGKELDLNWPKDPWKASPSLLDYIQPSVKQHHASHLTDKEKENFQVYEILYQEIRSVQWYGSFENNTLGFNTLRDEVPTLSTSNRQLTSELRQHNNLDLVDSLLSVVGQYQKETDIFQTKLERIAVESSLPLFIQISFPSSKKRGGLIERVHLLPDVWKEISIPVPEPLLLGHEPIIIKPLNINGTVRIAAITLNNQATGECVWAAKTAKDFVQITVQDQALRLPDTDCLKIMVLGDNPSLVLPKTPVIADSPLEIVIYLKVTRDQVIIRDFLQKTISAVGQHSVGTIHHFSCSGGTVICKCLAAMRDVVLLSEINPSNPGIIWFNPFDPLQQFQKNYPELSYSSIGDLKKIFLERISWVLDKSIEKNKALIVRDHSHWDFLMDGCVDAPPLYTFLTEIAMVKPIVTLRNPIDSYLSLQANPSFITDAKDFDTYCQRVLTFLEKYHFAEVFCYEEFLENPDSILKRMCCVYGIEFDPTYKDRFHKIKLTGNSGRGKNFKEIKELERRPYNNAFKREVLESESFMKLSEKYKYHL